MNSLNRILKYQFKDMKLSILIFLAILLIINIILPLISVMADSEFLIGININDAFSSVSSNVFAIITFLLIYCYNEYYENFPISISFSVTRKDFFKSLVISNIFIVLVFSLVQTILLKAEPIFLNAMGLIPLEETLIFNTKTDSFFKIFYHLFIIFSVCTSIWTLIASINYKFGTKLWFVIVGIFIVLVYLLNFVSIGRVMKFLIPIDMNSNIDGVEFIYLLGVTAVFYIISYAVTRRTNVKPSLN